MSIKSYKLKVPKVSIGDFEMEYMSPEEREERWAQHRQSLKELEESGEPNEVEIEIVVEENSLLDGVSQAPTESYRMEIWDASSIKE
jgi:hypothetical protein